MPHNKPTGGPNNDDSWTRVVPTRNGGRRFVKSPALSLSTTPQGLNDCLPDDTPAQLRSKFLNVKTQIASSRFLTSFLAILQPWFSQIMNDSVSDDSPSKSKALPGVLCYGLGNPANDKTSLYQLAFLDLLIDRCPLDRSAVHLYDPLFRSTAHYFLESDLCLHVIQHNEEGFRSLDDTDSNDRPYFIFLPHCSAALTNNLLYANWSPRRLSQTLFFSNSWRQSLEQHDYAVSSQLSSQLKDTPSGLVYMRRMIPLVEERSVGSSIDHLHGTDCEAFLSGCFEAMMVTRVCFSGFSNLSTADLTAFSQGFGPPVYDPNGADGLLGDILRNS